VTRYNADLANDLGNLVSRVLTMVQRYCGGKVPPIPLPPAAGAVSFEQDLQLGSVRRRLEAVLDRYEELDFSGALAEPWAWITQLNQSIVREAPWELAKQPGRREALEAFLYRLLEGVRLVAVAAFPVMPRACRRVLRMLGASGEEPRQEDLAWGRLVPGTSLGAIEPLFPRIETKEKNVSDDKPAVPATAPAPAPAPPGGDRIDIAEFGRVELRAAQVLEAEKVAGSKKLIRLQLDLGTERRQVVAGIAESYAPETLVGKKVAVVANLKPAKLMGVESNGMVLAASVDGKAVLLTFDQDVAPGTRIK
jgi:methionyl-tRNA synthetase